MEHVPVDVIGFGDDLDTRLHTDLQEPDLVGVRRFEDDLDGVDLRGSANLELEAVLDGEEVMGTEAREGFGSDLLADDFGDFLVAGEFHVGTIPRERKDVKSSGRSF